MLPALEKKAPVGLSSWCHPRGNPLTTADGTMWAPGYHRFWFWFHWGLLLLLLLEAPLRGLALPPIRYSHAGICPNDMNPNLWVDAQSTCKRECETDQVSEIPEA